MWVSVDYPCKQITHVTVGEGQEPHCLMTITASFRLRLVIVGNCDISIRVKHILKWDQKNPNKQTKHHVEDSKPWFSNMVCIIIDAI